MYPGQAIIQLQSKVNIDNIINTIIKLLKVCQASVNGLSNNPKQILRILL